MHTSTHPAQKTPKLHNPFRTIANLFRGQRKQKVSPQPQQTPNKPIHTPLSGVPKETLRAFLEVTPKGNPNYGVLNGALHQPSQGAQVSSHTSDTVSLPKPPTHRPGALSSKQHTQNLKERMVAVDAKTKSLDLFTLIPKQQLISYAKDAIDLSKTFKKQGNIGLALAWKNKASWAITELKVRELRGY